MPKLAILSIQPMLKPRNDITMPNTTICLLSGIKATHIGINMVLISKSLKIVILKNKLKIN